jgi:hypothetical protein
MAKFYTITEIQNKLQTSDKWLINGLLAIYAGQTSEEKDADQTVEQNGIGFNGVDAEILSSFAKQVLAWQATPPEARRYPTPLSQPRGDKPGQMGLLRRKMGKYAGQLFRIAAANHPDVYAAPSAPVHENFDSLLENRKREAFEAKKQREIDATAVQVEKLYRGGAQAELEVDADEAAEAAAEAAAERAAIMAEEFDGELVEALAW